FGVVAGDVHRQHPVVLAGDVHPFDATGVASHRPHVLLGEAGGVPRVGDHEDVVFARGQPHLDQLVVVADLDRDDAVGADRGVVGEELGFLDQPVGGGEGEVLVLLEVPG